jgi:hypothetical protein
MGFRIKCSTNSRSCEGHYIIYGIQCHMCNSVVYLVLRHMLGYIDD